MRCLIFKFVLSEPSIFNRHLRFLCLGSKSVQIFYFVLNLNWSCSKCVQIALFASWNLTFNTFFWLAVWFHAFSTIVALLASWKLLELLYIGFAHKLRIIVSSTSVQDPNRAASATFRTQIEQIQTHFEQPQIRFRKKWKFKRFLSLSLRNLNAYNKLKKNFKKKFKTAPLSGHSNLVRQSL